MEVVRRVDFLLGLRRDALGADSDFSRLNSGLVLGRFGLAAAGAPVSDGSGPDFTFISGSMVSG